jgi:hypothetical protein
MRFVEIALAQRQKKLKAITPCLRDAQGEHPDAKALRKRKPKPRPFNEPKPDNLS